MLGIRDDTSNRALNAVRKRNLERALDSSDVAFACGSGYRYPVAKFFEIPAGRTAIFGVPFLGASDAGFIDGHSFVVCAPEDFAARFREASPSELAELSKNLLHTMEAIHSGKARGDQLADIVSAGLSGSKVVRASFVESNYLVSGQ